jgi:hypothetical protein
VSRALRNVCTLRCSEIDGAILIQKRAEAAEAKRFCLKRKGSFILSLLDMKKLAIIYLWNVFAFP